ncbi:MULTISPECIES: TIM-barrel domain-containing protein [unclassified Streptomyces]|uniref:glycoside hydrolase family 31 protein n=1 Tax=unclassified Streptomyces TaxID=2593676 RepID=UPI001BE71258|nr:MULTISPECIES: TIM-barrel domain-containing protein [unclassified Streptomyces]MBT2407323.1 glycosyl hydrolase [Streptomyces sp. ISL-21]MBT2613380.1 glycosyl hydrolase [Streptomyces sp. ISL-87]
MDGRDLVRAVKEIGTARGRRAWRSAWRHRRADAVGLPRRGAERARVPGLLTGTEPRPGGGVLRFARSELLVRVTVGGAVFWGWDGAEPTPSYAVVGSGPEPDPRAVLEADTGGGWRVVSERVTVAVSRHGAVEIRTPGGTVLRRELPPRWWEPVEDGAGGAAVGGDVPGQRRPGGDAAGGDGGRPGGGSVGEGRPDTGGPGEDVPGGDGPGGDGPGEGGPGRRRSGWGGARWVQRAEVPADARFFGLGGRAGGPRLRDGAYRLWNTDPKGGFGPGHDPLYITMPVQMVVADAGTHLVFHDNTWDGRVVLREGEEGAGSGPDRPGLTELRMEGGPLRCWVLVGTPARVLQGWSGLTGAAAVPPEWALGYQHARWGFGSAAEVRRVVSGYASRGLALSAIHLDIDHYDAHRVFTVDKERFPDLPGLAGELREQGVRLVSIVDPAVKAGDPVHTSGLAVGPSGAFVRDARGREVRGEVWPGECAYPDFTDPAVREWWGGLYTERLAQGFSGIWHDMNEPVSFAPFGDPTLPRSARHALDGAGGDHRAAHNVYALGMARAGWEGLVRLRPAERPFLFSRSGWAGMQRYGGTWSGDVETGWEGLRASLALVLGLGVCGVPYSGPDVGGFGGSPSPELYLRWLQLGSYLPLFRTHSAIWAGRREPWEFGPEVAEHARAVLAERERLRPYFVTLAHLARRTGAPYVRPVWWGAPEDRGLRDCEDAFLLGDALLVAPVLECGSDRRAVRLPRGRWHDTATGAAYDGPGQVLLDAPAGRIPVLARAGSVLPVRSGDGSVALEAWAPARGRTGGGVVIRDPGPGFEPGEVERYTVRWVGDAVVVETEAGAGVAGVTVRGL